MVNFQQFEMLYYQNKNVFNRKIFYIASVSQFKFKLIKFNTI